MDSTQVEMTKEEKKYWQDVNLVRNFPRGNLAAIKKVGHFSHKNLVLALRTIFNFKVFDTLEEEAAFIRAQEDPRSEFLLELMPRFDATNPVYPVLSQAGSRQPSVATAPAVQQAAAPAPTQRQPATNGNGNGAHTSYGIAAPAQQAVARQPAVVDGLPTPPPDSSPGTVNLYKFLTHIATRQEDLAQQLIQLQQGLNTLAANMQAVLTALDLQNQVTEVQTDLLHSHGQLQKLNLGLLSMQGQQALQVSRDDLLADAAMASDEAFRWLQEQAVEGKED
jgi:hypothetical protein